MSSEADAEALDARARRRTWTTGGALLVLAAAVGLVARGPLGWMHYGKDWLWGIGVLVLAIGIGSAGSITGRRPFATIVVILQVIVASPAVSWYLSTHLADYPPSTNAREDAWAALFIPYYLVVFILTLVAAFLIGTARAVPRPWSWAPLWVVLVALAFGLASALGGYALGGFTVVYLPMISTVLLGILAIVLGIRSIPPSVVVQ